MCFIYQKTMFIEGMREEIYKQFRERTDRIFVQQFLKRSPSGLSHEITDGNKCRECPLKQLSVAKTKLENTWKTKKKKAVNSELQMWV